MCLSNFKAIRQFKVPISWLRNFTRSYEKTSFRILRRGPVVNISLMSCTMTTQSVTAFSWMGLLPDTQNRGLRMRRGCRELFFRHRRDACRDRCSSGENVSGIPGVCISGKRLISVVRDAFTDCLPDINIFLKSCSMTAQSVTAYFWISVVLGHQLYHKVKHVFSDYHIKKKHCNNSNQLIKTHALEESGSAIQKRCPDPFINIALFTLQKAARRLL